MPFTLKKLENFAELQISIYRVCLLKTTMDFLSPCSKSW